MKSILLLEDNHDLARDWQAGLENEGFRVVHESDVEDAIAAYDQIEFDLVIKDVIILRREKSRPKGGLLLLTHIFCQGEGSVRPKTIAVSGAHYNDSILRHAEKLRADLALAKPFEVEVLCGAAKDLLASS